MEVASIIFNAIDVSVRIVELVKSIKGADKARQELIQKLQRYAELLPLIRDVYQDSDMEATWPEVITDLGNPNGALERLDQLQMTLERRSGYRPPLKHLFDSVRWPLESKAIKEFVTSIERENTQLVNALSVHQARLKAFEQYRQSALDMLECFDCSAAHDQTADHNQAGPGRKLLESTVYLDWKSNTGSCLLCLGQPGVGKSVVARMVINDLSSLIGSKSQGSNIAIAYIYIRQDSQQQQQLSSVNKSLLVQLLKQKRKQDSRVAELAKRYKERSIRPSPEEVKELLIHTAGRCEKLFVVLDGLDEYDQSRAGELLSQMRSLQLLAGANVLATSRNIHFLVNRLPKSIKMKIQATKEDFRQFAHLKVEEMGSVAIYDQSLVKRIKEKITATAFPSSVFQNFSYGYC